MDQSSGKKKTSVLKVFILSFVIFLIFGGGAFGWYFLADVIEARINVEKERLAKDGKVIDCTNQRIEGFPFRVGLFCDKVQYEDLQTTIGFEAGQFRSAAQFYNPGFVVGELDGPAQLNLPDLGKIDVEWQLVKTNTNVGLDGLKRVSLGVNNPAVKGKIVGQKYIPDIRMSLMELHMRAAGEQAKSPDAELAVKLNDLEVVDHSGNKLPVITVQSDGVVNGLNQALRQGQDLQAWMRANGLELNIRSFDAMLAEGGRIEASGPLNVDVRGLVSGKLDVNIEDFDKILKSAIEINPQLAETGNLLQQATALLTKGNGNKFRLQLQIKDGQISAGIIPLGIIPPLF